MKFDTPYELAEHLYKETTEPDMPIHERGRIAVLATRFALDRWEEHAE